MHALQFRANVIDHLDNAGGMENFPQRVWQPVSQIGIGFVDDLLAVMLEELQQRLVR